MNILILDDNEVLLKRLSKNISEYTVIASKTIEEAFDALKREDVSFIAVDYDLGHSKTGDILYDLLFKSGKTIPAIVFSGKELTDESQVYLKQKGFSKILSKVDDEEESLSDLIVKAAKEILDSCIERTFHVEMKSKILGVGNHPIAFGKYVKTIDEWIEALKNCEIQKEQEKDLKERIIEHCNIYDTHQGMYKS